MVATVSANVGHYRAHNEDKSRSEKAKVLHVRHYNFSMDDYR